MNTIHIHSKVFIYGVSAAPDISLPPMQQQQQQKTNKNLSIYLHDKTC